MSSLFYLARRFKTATALNLLGLTVAFAAFYLFMTQVLYNHSFNRELTDADRLYRFELTSLWGDNEGRWSSNTSRFAGEELATVPQVESVMLAQSGWYERRYLRGDSEFHFDFLTTDSHGLTTLQPRCLDGRLDWDEGDTGGVLIAESIARTYFNNETQVAGRALWDGQDSITVRGVYADFPEACGFKNAVVENFGDRDLGAFNNYNFDCYVRLTAEADTATVLAAFRKAYFSKLRDAMTSKWGAGSWDKVGDTYGAMQFRLTPVTETYFSGVDDRVDKGNRLVDGVLIVACVLLLIVAAINFLNFTLAEAPMRVKGVNTRRVLGSTLGSIRIALIAETVATALAAYVLAMGAAYLLTQWPLMGELTVGNINLDNHLPLLAWTALLAMAVGIVAGIYPAFYVTSFQPALALKGSAGLTPRGRQLRTALIALQLFISCIMVVYIAILYLQSHYLFTSDYGFDKDEVLYVRLNNELRAKKDAAQGELLRLSGVEDVAYSQFLLGVGNGFMSWGRGDDDHQIETMAVFPVSWQFLRTMGIRIVEGRDFNQHDHQVFIINEAGRRAWNWVEMDKPLLSDMGNVVGVCADLRFSTARADRTQKPMAFIAYDENDQDFGAYNYMFIRTTAGTDKVQLRRMITESLTGLGLEEQPEVRFIDQDLEITYQEELRFIRQVLVFSVICLIITLIGVFCLTLFETEYRRKEIGIRKVFGSTEEAILLLLSRRYVAIILLSFLLAAPAAYYLGTQWLQSFAERTPIHWWLFPLALAAICLVTLATVCIQGWRAATENPVNSIKTE